MLRDAIGGRQLIWDREAVRRLDEVQDLQERERIKTRIEKKSLTRRLNSVSLQMVLDESEVQNDGALIWTDDAIARLERVPEGFMRKAAKTSVEEYASENNLIEISLQVAEEGLVKAREKMMEAMQGKIAHSSQADSEEKTVELTWTPEALKRLERVPAGFMRDMSKARIEEWGKAHEYDLVSLEVVEEKYQSWTDGSKGLKPELEWAETARDRIEKVPEFIRPMVMKEIERKVQSQGKSYVDESALDQVMDAWGGSLDSFHQRN